VVKASVIISAAGAALTWLKDLFYVITNVRSFLNWHGFGGKSFSHTYKGGLLTTLFLMRSNDQKSPKVNLQV
jgi:hypothetical protein